MNCVCLLQIGKGCLLLQIDEVCVWLQIDEGCVRLATANALLKLARSQDNPVNADAYLQLTLTMQASSAIPGCHVAVLSCPSALTAATVQTPSSPNLPSRQVAPMMDRQRAKGNDRRICACRCTLVTNFLASGMAVW